MILNNCELHFVRLDPTRPNAKYEKANPVWEIQMRTSDKDQKKAWQAAGLRVTAVVPDDDSDPYFKANLRKRSIKSDGEKALPVELVDGNLNPIDPNTIGNGSVGNLRVFQYEYNNEESGPGVASILMAVQITKHVVYVPQPKAEREEFGAVGDTEVVKSEAVVEAEREIAEQQAAEKKSDTAGLTPPGAKPVAEDDDDDDVNF
ncbi:hypothetical protein N9112_00220 [bacterium]|nr:hypothetical protein [bacterium]